MTASKWNGHRRFLVTSRFSRRSSGERAELVVIDPLSAFLNGRVDSHRDQDVRGALAPLAKIADRTGATILVVRHLSKSGGGNPLYRGGGSIGIIGAARAAMLVAPDPEDDGRRILACTKNNLGPMPLALAYRVVSDEERGCARIEWDGTTSHSAADLLAIPSSRERTNPTTRAVLAGDPQRRAAMGEGLFRPHGRGRILERPGEDREGQAAASRRSRSASPEMTSPAGNGPCQGSTAPPKGAKGATPRTPLPSLPWYPLRTTNRLTRVAHSRSPTDDPLQLRRES